MKLGQMAQVVSRDRWRRRQPAIRQVGRGERPVAEFRSGESLEIPRGGPHHCFRSIHTCRSNRIKNWLALRGVRRMAVGIRSSSQVVMAALRRPLWLVLAGRYGSSWQELLAPLGTAIAHIDLHLRTTRPSLSDEAWDGGAPAKAAMSPPQASPL